MPRPVRIEKKKDRAVICNIVSVKRPVFEMTYGNFQIESPAPGEEYALTIIEDALGYKDMGDHHKETFTISAWDIADDLVRLANADGVGGGSNFGLFVCDGPHPTKGELAEAHALLKAYYVRRVSEADQNWERGGMHRMNIDDTDRRGARYLGLNDKPWLFDTKPMEECPACGDRIKTGVAVCKSCGAILDAAKAEKFGLIDRIHEEPKQKPVKVI